MYKLFENFRNSLQEIGDADGEHTGVQSRRSKFKILKFEAVVVTSKRHGMTVSDYLSRIRSVEGITIVRAEETLEQKLHNTTKLLFKVDAEYLPENSTDAIKEQIRSQILAIPGVTRFTYIALPVSVSK